MLSLVAELEGKVGFGLVGSGCLEIKRKKKAGRDFFFNTNQDVLLFAKILG